MQLAITDLPHFNAGTFVGLFSWYFFGAGCCMDACSGGLVQGLVGRLVLLRGALWFSDSSPVVLLQK